MPERHSHHPAAHHLFPEPWLPELGVLLSLREQHPKRYSYGFDKIEWPSELSELRDRIISYCNDRYFFRRIGQETLPRWQHQLQLCCDLHAPEWIALHRSLAAVTDPGVAEITETASDTTGSSASSSSGSTHDRGSEPVDQAVDPSQYASEYREGTSASHSDGSSEGHTTARTTRRLAGSAAIGEALKIASYSLLPRIADDFEDCFLHVYIY